MASNVLIVDRDPQAMGHFMTRLRLLGYTPLSAEPSEAESLAGETELGVILLQVGSLKEEALRLLTGLKRIRPEVPVILLSTRRDIALSIKGMKLGAFDDLIAPFDVAALNRRIQSALAHKWRRDRRRGGTAVLPEAVKRFALAVGLKETWLWYGEAILWNGGLA